MTISKMSYFFFALTASELHLKQIFYQFNFDTKCSRVNYCYITMDSERQGFAIFFFYSRFPFK